MIRGIGDVLSLTYAQTLNGYASIISCVNVGTHGDSKWAIFGKQNWR